MIPIARRGTAGRAAEAAIETIWIGSFLDWFVGAGFGIGSKSAVVCRAVGFLSLFQLSRAKFKLTRRRRIAIEKAWRIDGAGWRFALRARPSRRVVSHNRQAKALNLRGGARTPWARRVGIEAFCKTAPRFDAVSLSRAAEEQDSRRPLSRRATFLTDSMR